MSPQFSFVMPCLNEARTIGACIQKAKALIEARTLDAEIVVADNHSDDGSRDIARALGARVVDVERKGYGSAIAAGIAAAEGRYVIMADSDASYDFSEAGPIVDALLAGNDLVIGDRYEGGIRPGAMPWSHKYIGVPVLSWIGRLVSWSRVFDFHCGMRGFERKKVVDLKIESRGMEYCTEMIIRAALAGLKTVEVPVTLYPDGRGGRPPHLRTIPDGFKNLFSTLRMIPRRSELRSLGRR